MDKLGNYFCIKCSNGKQYGLIASIKNIHDIKLKLQKRVPCIMRFQAMVENMSEVHVWGIQPSNKNTQTLFVNFSRPEENESI